LYKVKDKNLKVRKNLLRFYLLRNGTEKLIETNRVKKLIFVIQNVF